MKKSNNNKNKNETEDIWNTVLHSGKILSNEEANAMLRTVKKIRKEYGFRKMK